ncbi:MAG: hypothetical protein MRY83_23985 [Flavobacteriales bacterium]|nr:hypothetical protein [Flavobacteriales bacterium]
MKKSQIAGLVALVIILIGTFLPYVEVGDQSFTMFGLNKQAKTVAIVFIVLGVLGGLFSFLGKGKVWWLSIISLLIFGLTAYVVFAHLGKLGKSEMAIGVSMYAIATGAVVGLISGGLGIAKK